MKPVTHVGIDITVRKNLTDQEREAVADVASEGCRRMAKALQRRHLAEDDVEIGWLATS